MTIAIPLDALADFEGSTDSPVVLESAAPDRTVVRWDDRGIPQSREYNLVTPVDRLEPIPPLPATWASNPAELLDALAETTDTTIADSPRYPSECLQLQGRGQILATDGRQLLVRSSFHFPWSEDLLIKGRPIFACRALPRDQPIEIGRTETHVVIRAGNWTIFSVIQKEARFPAVQRVIPTDGEISTRLRLDAADARFLESALGRLPGSDEHNSPVTLELNGRIAVRAHAPDQPQQITELVLSRSNYTGSPICIATNRVLLDRALRLGFTEVGFAGAESPFVCRDERRIFTVQPLSDGLPAPANAIVTRIESSTAAGGESPVPARTETPRRPTSETVRRNGHQPARPAETNGHVTARRTETTSSNGTDQPGTTLAVLIQEAEALHATLADAKSRTARLIAGLRRHRKQSRLVNETLKSLRQLRLVESAG